MKKILILIICLSVYQLNAQQVGLSLLSSSGDYFENENYSISWSLGELAVETLSNTDNIITQGFQQTKLSTVGINENSLNNIHLTIYPNPAINEIFILSKGLENHEYLIQIFNILSSKKIEQRIFINEQKPKIKLNNLNPGTYMLVINSNDKRIYQTFLFQKVE